MLKIIQTILHGGVSFMTYFVGLHICLTRREKYQISSMLIAIAAVGFNIYIIASLNHYKVFGMIDFAMFISCAMLRFKEKAPFKLLIVFLLNALSMLCELVLDVFFFPPGQMFTGTDYNLKNIAFIITYIIFYSAMLYILSGAVKSIRSNELHFDKYATFFFLVPISQYLLFASSTLNTRKKPEVFQQMINKPMMYAGIVITVVADILIFKALLDYSTARHNKLRLAELEYEQKLSQNYYDSIRKNAEQLMKYKHDFNNIVSTAYSLLSSADPEQRERGMQILGELYQKNLKNPIIPHYCANSTINAVIFDKMNAADERGVELVTDINIPENMKVELTDLCSVFANLIDNAFASAEKSKNNKVELSAHTDIGCLFVLAKNYPDEMPQLPAKKSHFKNGKFSEHGYGLDIIRGVAEKYDGSLEMRTENGCVEILAVLKLT